MPGTRDRRYQEAELLARAVENVLRKLIRFLVGRISLVRLQEMIRHIYVEETQNKLQSETPGRNVPLTRLALNTGLDTRALVQIRERLQTEGPQYRQQFLAELTPESAVVEAWASRVREEGAPGAAAELRYGSDDAAFEGGQEAGPEDAQEPREHHPADAPRPEEGREVGVEVGSPLLAVGAVVEDRGGDAARLGARESGGVGAVRGDDGDRVQPPAGLRALQDRHHVRAAAGDEDRRRLGRHRHSTAGPPGRRSATCPNGNASNPIADSWSQ